MTNTANEDARRRAYWTASMDRARHFMDRMMEYPVRESGEPLASIPEAARAAGIEIEFSETPIVDDLPRIFEVREGLIEPLLAAAREMSERGWLLVIEDSFRTEEMQRRLAVKPEIFDAILRKTAWEAGTDEPDPELVFRRVSVLVAAVPKVAGHMSGCAVDISVLDRNTRRPLDRGGPYLEMSEKTPMFSPFVSPAALGNRADITAIMEKHGFAAYPYEFWHYSRGDVFAKYLAHSTEAACYAAVVRDPGTGSVHPVKDLTVALHTDSDLRGEIEKAMVR